MGSILKFPQRRARPTSHSTAHESDGLPLDFMQAARHTALPQLDPPGGQTNVVELNDYRNAGRHGH